jgi:hypothetical protein
MDRAQQITTHILAVNGATTFEEQVVEVRRLFEFIEQNFEWIQIGDNHEFLETVQAKAMETLDHFEPFLSYAGSDEQYDLISATLQAAYRVYSKIQGDSVSKVNADSDSDDEYMPYTEPFEM